jgi:DNA helicase II / ATP-dependent DNA helicase PcrA
LLTAEETIMTTDAKNNRQPSPLLATLNPEQRSAAEHGVTGTGANIAGPLLVIAGAGTGKTNVLAHRTANLIARGADPRRILLLTFTRLAADEMKARVAGILSSPAQRRTRVDVPWSGTFHAIGMRLLRSNARRIGLADNFTVLDRSDAEALMGRVRNQLRLGNATERFPDKSTCLNIYSYRVNACLKLKTVLERQYPDMVTHKAALRQLSKAYVAEKQQQNILDYDDLLLYWAELLSLPNMATRIGGLFDHVLVDEFQDTNALQARIVRRLKPDGCGVMVVGDDAQAIYGFRAAEPRNILRFPGHFDPPATVIKLEQNYRSTKPILRASNAVIDAVTEGFKKALRTDRKGGDKPALVALPDEQAQATFVVDQVLDGLQRGRKLKQQAVLFRAGHHSSRLELELTARKIPFVKFGGVKFLEAAHVKEVLAVLRWAENPTDHIAGRRILELLPGIGDATASRIMAAIGARDLADALSAMKAPTKEREWLALCKVLRRLTDRKADWPGQVERVRRWYKPYLEHRYDDAQQRDIDLEQLQGIATGFASRVSFLSELMLDPPTKTGVVGGTTTDNDDMLTLATVHAIKGREWQAVFVLNVVDGCIPSSRAKTTAELDEERRLLYVAMTRAKSQLTLITPRLIGSYGGGGFNQATFGRSRFIADAMLPLFERRSWSADPDTDGEQDGDVEWDFKARIRALAGS